MLILASDWLTTVKYGAVSHVWRHLTSAWDIKTKERHWWRHNGDSDRRPPSLPLWYDLVTLCLYDDLGQINVIAGILKLRKRFRMSQIMFEHGIKSLPHVYFRGYGNLSTLGLRPRVVLRCCVWINSRIRVSKQGVTNNINILQDNGLVQIRFQAIFWSNDDRYKWHQGWGQVLLPVPRHRFCCTCTCPCNCISWTGNTLYLYLYLYVMYLNYNRYKPSTVFIFNYLVYNCCELYCYILCKTDP